LKFIAAESQGHGPSNKQSFLRIIENLISIRTKIPPLKYKARKAGTNKEKVNAFTDI
jgi:hypothetical protein